MDMCDRFNEKHRIIKNLVAFSLVYLLIFSAINGLVSIQSVLNQDAGLGILALLLSFFIQFLTCLILPQLVCNYVGFKSLLVYIELSAVVYVASNMYPKFYTLLPSSALFGFTSSIMWTICGIYLQNLSKLYARVIEKPFFEVQNLFFSVFGSIYVLCNSLGSLLVATIIKTDELNATALYDNISIMYALEYDFTKHCGLNNCPDTPLPLQSSKPTLNSVYLLCGTMIILCLISIFITIFLVDNIPTDCEPSRRRRKSLINDKTLCSTKKVKSEFVNLFKLFKSIDIYLLLPITAYTSYDLSFKWTEFNRAYVTCLTNVNYIGWTSILFGLLGAVFSISTGVLSKYIGQYPILLLSLCISVFVSIFMLTWASYENSVVVMFLITAAFSYSQSVCVGQVRGLYGTQFPSNNSAFSANTLFINLGFIFGYICSLYMCTKMKVYIYFCISALSFICYGILIVKNSYIERKEMKIALAKEQDQMSDQQTIDIDLHLAF